MDKTDLTFCSAPRRLVVWHLWPGAEDKALRGRNLSAVSRTLDRQVGQTDPGLPACAQPWRVENQSDKSTVRPSWRSFAQDAALKTSFPQNQNSVSTKQPQSSVYFLRASPKFLLRITPNWFESPESAGASGWPDRMIFPTGGYRYLLLASFGDIFRPDFAWSYGAASRCRCLILDCLRSER
jgi:hypothetical protein